MVPLSLSLFQQDQLVFKHPDPEVFTDSVLCYIKNCIDTVTVDKHIRVYPNQKPWMNQKVHP